MALVNALNARCQSRPAVAQKLRARDRRTASRSVLVGQVGDTGVIPLVAPGDIEVRIAAGRRRGRDPRRRDQRHGDSVMSRSLSSVPRPQDAGRNIAAVVLHDDARELRVIGPPAGRDLEMRISEWPIGNGNLIARIGVPRGG